MVLNLSSPNPIMIAENVPPKTINIEEKRNNALNEPPSRKNAPKIESKPRISPIIVPSLFIINNQKVILDNYLPKVYWSSQADNLCTADP